MLRSTVMQCLIVGMSMLLLTNVAFSAGDWESADIGENTEAGSTEIVGDVFTIVGNGTDIWGTADEFRYVYQEASGDFEISAHVVSQEVANEWSKTGLMVRQSLDPGHNTRSLMSHQVTARSLYAGLHRELLLVLNHLNRTSRHPSGSSWSEVATNSLASGLRMGRIGSRRKYQARPASLQ